MKRNEPTEGGVCLSNRSQIMLIALLLWTMLCTIDAHARTITAASCSLPAVTAAYNSASSGDSISVPPGDCAWTASLVLSKNNISLLGAGINTTYIRLGSYGGPALQIGADNVRISGFTFDCNYQYTSNTGVVRVGTNETNPSYTYSDFRIDHNRFIQCDNAGNTGYSAIVTRGFVYGVIDNNIFDDCTGECLDVCSDGVTDGISRSKEFGQYTNGTIYIEDNTWNYYHTGYNAENAIDGNSASRWVMRYNTFNIGPSSRVSALISNHETCATCSCDSTRTGDAGSLVMEIYGNKIYNYGTHLSNANLFVIQRGGRSLIYNNTIYQNDTYAQPIVQLRNYRSFNYGNCWLSAHARGYSQWCHDSDPGYTAEGRLSNKTTISSALGLGDPSVSVASVAAFPAYGGSIIIGSEQIDYTGISGNTLTGCTRGANGTSAATHASGSSVDLLVFGQCLEQPNNTYVWGNKTVGNADKNGVSVYTNGPSGGHNDYSAYDIQSYDQRPNNWQYRTGYAYSYSPYPYPHPVRRLSPPLNFRIGN